MRYDDNRYNKYLQKTIPSVEARAGSSRILVPLVGLELSGLRRCNLAFGKPSQSPPQPGENSEAANSFLIYWMLLVTFVFLCERDSS
jgi:hypothetical protein